MEQEVRRLQIAEKIVRVRQQQLNQEVAALEDLRRRKTEAMNDMQKAWREYMAGADRINKMRMGDGGAMLEAIETGLDAVKQRWLDGLATVKQLEHAEQAQMQRVRVKQGEVKVTERLEERSQQAVDAIERKREQRTLDDFGVRRFNEARRGNG